MVARTGLVLVLGSLLGCTGASSSSADSTPHPAPPSSAAAAGAPLAQLPPPDPREARLALAITHLLENQHLRNRPLDDELSRTAFDEFVEQLDPAKMFLLAADAAALETYATTIDDQLKSGRLELAHAGAARFQARRAVVATMVAELLAQPFDASDEEFLETDPEKLTLATTDAELRDRWRKRLELEVLERVAVMEDQAAALAGKQGAKEKKLAEESADGTPPLSAAEIPPTREGREAKARADMATSYAARFARLATPDKLDAAASLVNAVTAMFDPHTNYLPPSDKANFDIQLTGSLEGIGAVLREDDRYIRVVEIVPGGASWRQGELEAGDLILSVAQDGKQPVDTANMRIDDVVKMIRGPKGTNVTLSIQKPDTAVKTLRITRDVVVIEEAYARAAVLQTKGDKRAYGYIYLPSFYGGQLGKRSAASDVRRLLEELRGKKVAGVVIDVRGNGGGLLDDARVMTGLFIDRGPVVQTQVGGGDKEVLTDDEPGTSFEQPVVVLVDHFSASASEILAGALQDYKRAVVVGTGPTHGKGTVQVLADLNRLAGSGDDLGVLKLTVQQFFRVSGASTQWQGVVPDVLLPDPLGYLDTGERQLDHSLPYSEIEAVPHTDWPAGWKLDAIVARSQARQSKNTVFTQLVRRTEILKGRKAETRTPLQRDAWLTRRAKLRDELDAVTPDLEEGPVRVNVTTIDEGKKAVEARPNGKGDDRLGKWKNALARDPFVEESLMVLRDMQGTGIAATHAPGHAPAR